MYRQRPKSQVFHHPGNVSTVKSTAHPDDAVVGFTPPRPLNFGYQLIKTLLTLFRRDYSLIGNLLIPMAMTTDTRSIKVDARIRRVHDAASADSGSHQSFPVE